MGAFTSVSVLSTSTLGKGRKSAIVSAVAPASYDAGGSVIALTTTTLGALDGFTTISGGHLLMATHTTPASSIKYLTQVVAGTGASPKIVMRDADAGTACAQVSGDVSAVTLVMQFYGT